MASEQDFRWWTVHGRWMSADCEPGLVSVIIPAWNRAQLLDQAIQSVARQTYRPVEVLIVDDGSTDSTPEIAAQWSRKFEQGSGTDPGFRIRSLWQQHGGAPAARNLGLIESRGEFVQFLDSDDLLCPEKVEVCVAALTAAPDIDYVFTGRVFVTDAATDKFLDERAKRPLSVPPPVVVPAGKMAYIPAQAVLGMFRRRLCQRMGPWTEALVRHQDWEYTTRVVAATIGALRIRSPLYVIRTHAFGRIDDLRTSRIKALDARLASVLAAEQRAMPVALDPAAGEALSRRLRSRYLKILRQAVKALSARHISPAIRGLGRSIARPADTRQL